jgi:DNA-binding FrmR family transcriptional regulator
MAIRSGFFNSIGGDRTYDASRFAEYFSAFIGTGVFPEPTTGLQIQADTGMDIKIKAGKAWINGYILVNDADYTEAIPSEAILNRIDRIVVRLHYANREMTIVRKAGTAASTPSAPAVTRDANMYELSLGTIAINAGTSTITSGMITDTRSDSNVCGFASSTITNLPYLTPQRVLISDTDGTLIASSITQTQLEYLSGVNSNIQTQLNAKQATINGAASTIVSSNLTANRAVISNSSGKVAASSVSNTELEYLSGINSNIQTQLNAKQATINGAASTVVSSNLTANRAVISDSNGKIAVSAATSTEIGYLSGVTSAIQTQLNNKLGSTAQANDSLRVNGRRVTVATTAPSSPSVNDVWIDTN